MATEAEKNSILNKKTALGIEFGSTRIKAVLVDENHIPIASGDHEWENRLEDGIWTYSLEDIWSGLQLSLIHICIDHFISIHIFFGKQF